MSGVNKTLFLLIFTLFLLSGGCSSSNTTGGGDEGGGGGEEGEGGSDVILTTAGSVFPIDLVVTSPYATASAQASVSAGKTVEDFSAERGELQGILEGTTASACSFDVNLFQTLSASPECYGPTISYFNHPNGTGAEKNGSLPGNDLGIWNEYQGSEACSSAKVNQLFDSVSSKVNFAVNLFASMACSLNIADSELPPVGVTEDLKEVFGGILTGNNIAGITIATATLARAADNAYGHPVYDFAFTGTVASGDNSRDLELYLRHIPLSADNATYTGKLSYSMAHGVDADAGSVLYHKSGANYMTYRSQSAVYVANPGLTPDPLDDATRDIDPSIEETTDSVRGWNNNFNYILVGLDPQKGTGSVAFAWLAGSAIENTRVFNATIDQVGSAAKNGCAYYGYGETGLADLGSISGMICNWAGPNNQHLPNTFVQRQCMVEDNGVFVTDPALELNITYAPTNSCISAAEDNFTFYTGARTATNDHTDGGVGVNHNLMPEAGMSFTMPTAPEDVY